MFYQVRINLLFPKEADSKLLYQTAKKVLSKAGIINLGALNVEFSSIQRIKNNHDQDPNQPCELIEATDNQ